MRLVFGLLLIIVSFLGTIFFRRYDGTIIPYPILWYLFFVVLGLTGVLLIYGSIKKTERIFQQTVSAETEKLKSNAEKVELNFDKCEFKSGSYSHQVDDQRMSTVKLFAPGALGSIEHKINETVTQSYLIYTETINGTLCKFISQSFPFDQITLKFYVLKHNITLYVDRFNSEKYLFELRR